MPESTHQSDDLLERIRALEDEQVEALSERLAPQDDRLRATLAIVHLARNDRQGAARQIRELQADGTLSGGERAFLESYLFQEEGDYEGMEKALRSSLTDPECRWAEQCRLRLAIALIGRQRFSEVEEVLAPLLEPPGTEDSLEAYLLLIQSHVLSGPDKDQLIEWCATVDGLLEKGFRLHGAAEVIWYAVMMEQNGLDGVTEPLLQNHEGLLHSWKGGSAEDVEFLLKAGEKYKVPGAIHAAARGYENSPFPMEEAEVEKASFLLSSHEEHEAARLLIRTSCKPGRIRKRPELWGPLVLACYHAGRWKETLDLLREHRSELTGTRLQDSSILFKTVCEYNLGRFPEARRRMEDYGTDALLRLADPEEAATLVFIYWALGQADAGRELGTRAIDLRPEHEEESAEFRQAFPRILFDEVAIRRREDLVPHCMELTEQALAEPGLVARLLLEAMELMKWGLTEGALEIAAGLEGRGHAGIADMLRAIAAGERGEEAEMEALFESALQKSPKDLHTEVLLYRTSQRRRYGHAEQAMKDIEASLESCSAHLTRAMLLGAKAGLLADAERQEEADDLLVEASRKSPADTDERVPAYFPGAELTFYVGTDADALELKLDTFVEQVPDDMETLRTACSLAGAFDRTPAQEAKAKQIISEWEENYLLPKWQPGISPSTA